MCVCHYGIEMNVREFFPKDTGPRDGTSNTVMLVEVKREIPWTKPEDIKYDPEKALPKLKGFYEGGFTIGICDGSVKFLSGSIDKSILRARFTRAGGEDIGQF
jgi:hypothetical protein